MSQEHQPNELEQPQEAHRPVFDFERLQPEHTAALIHALGQALNAHNTAHQFSGPDPYEPLLDHVSRDLVAIAQRSDKAQHIYAALMNYKPPRHTTNYAADMAPELLRRNMGNPEVREWIIGLWVGMLHSEEHVVRHNGIDTVWATVADPPEWLDEPTRQYLESQLPGWFRELE